MDQSRNFANNMLEIAKVVYGIAIRMGFLGAM